jgi:hypothetical protein
MFAGCFDSFISKTPPQPPSWKTTRFRLSDCLIYSQLPSISGGRPFTFSPVNNSHNTCTTRNNAVFFLQAMKDIGVEVNKYGTKYRLKSAV